MTQKLEQLRTQILAFNEERNWEQYHSPKNIVMDLAAEVGELVEPFRWLTEEQSAQLDEKTLEKVREELGDVFRIILYLSDKLGIDPIEATQNKLLEMDKKYPVEQCYGKALKYTEYKQKDT